MFNNKPLVCTTCGYVGEPQRITKGSTLIELILWLSFLIPGLIYSIWRLSSKYDACPKCKGISMIPVDSPIGQKVIGEHKSVLGTDPVETYQIENKKETAKNTKLATVAIGSVIVLVAISAFVGQENAQEVATSTPVAETAPKNPTEQSDQKKLEMVFDVPRVLSKNYNQAKASLGEPTSIYTPTQLQLQQGVSYSATWEKAGISLQADYFNSAKPINYFFIGNNSGNSYSKAELMTLGNIQDPSKVKVVPQRGIKDPAILTGIHICSLGYKGESGIAGSENCK